MTRGKIFSSGLATPLSYHSLNLLKLTACVFGACWAGQPPALMAQEQTVYTEGRTSSITSVPVPLGGTGPQLLPTSERDVRNLLRGGLTVGTLYDDNAIPGNTQPSEYQVSVSPSLALQQTRPHTAWSLDYRGGLTMKYRRQETDPSIQDATSVTADLQHIFARRLQLELREDYIRTSDPFGSTGGSASVAALSGAGQLNSFIAVPAATRIAQVSSGNLTYQLTHHSSMGLSGSYSTQRFREVDASPGAAGSLIDTRTATGRAFYALEISRHQKIGFEFQLQDLRFQGNVARTLDQTVLVFDEIALKTNVTLTLYAGPDRTHEHNNILLLGSNASTSVVPMINDVWSPAGGAMFTWRGRFVAVELSGQRIVTDGSGFTGAVRATSASAELRRKFTKRWTGSLGYQYSDGRLLLGSANAGNSRVTLQQGTLTLERQLSERLVVRGHYARLQQESGGTLSPLTTGDHNRVGVELAYEFTRPLGR